MSSKSINTTKHKCKHRNFSPGNPIWLNLGGHILKYLQLLDHLWLPDYRISLASILTHQLSSCSLGCLSCSSWQSVQPWQPWADELSRLYFLKSETMQTLYSTICLVKKKWKTWLQYIHQPLDAWLLIGTKSLAMEFSRTIFNDHLEWKCETGTNSSTWVKKRKRKK